MSRCDVCLEEVDDGVSCAACVDVEGRIASATAALRARAERYRGALEKALGLIAANRLVLGEHMEPEYVARVEKQGREALAAGVGDG